MIKERNARIQDLQAKLDKLKVDMHKVNVEVTSGPNEEVLQDYSVAKLEYKHEVSEDTKGAMLRSKSQWYEQGERSTKYLYNLEKVNYNLNTKYEEATSN